MRFEMADNEEREEEATFSRGAEWEVVSLTASAYAAAPGVDKPDPTNRNNEKEDVMNSETSAALFMSGHFEYSQCEHENLPMEHESKEIHSELEGQNLCVPAAVDDVVIDKSDDGKFEIECDNSLHGIQFSDKEHTEYVHDVAFNEGSGSQQPSFAGREQQGMFVEDESVSFQSAIHKRENEMQAQELFSMNVGSPQDHRRTEDEMDGSDLPCQAWWRRHVASLYYHAKESNTFWSFFVAATVLGLAVLGHRWKQEKWQLQQIKWRLGMNEERMSEMLGPIRRFKHVLVGGHHQPSLLAHRLGASATI